MVYRAHGAVTWIGFSNQSKGRGTYCVLELGWGYLKSEEEGLDQIDCDMVRIGFNEAGMRELDENWHE